MRISLPFATTLLLLAAGTPSAAQQVVQIPATDVAARVRPQVLHAVGAEDGNDWEVFASVADVAFDASERLYVFDKGNARVVVFDSLGRFVRVIGKRGGGPGEFGTPMQMAVTDDGQVVVSDLGRGAFSLFGPDGAFRRSVPFAQGSLLVGPKLAPHPKGGVVSRAVGNPASGSADALGEEVVLWNPLGGGAPAPMFTVRGPRDRAAATSAGGLRLTRSPVFSPKPLFAVLPNGGLAVATGEEYSLQVVSPNGPVYRVLRRAIPPRRVTARDREHELERRRRSYSRPGGLVVAGAGGGALPPSLRAQAAERLQDVEFASVMPVIQGLEVDRAGNLWIQRSGPALDRPGPIDIVTPQGRYLATLTGLDLPAAFSPRGRAAYVAMDELGVLRVVVVRLPARWR